MVYSRAIDRLCEQDLFSFVCTRCVLYLVFESCSKDVSRCVYASLYFVVFFIIAGTVLISNFTLMGLLPFEMSELDTACSRYKHRTNT